LRDQVKKLISHLGGLEVENLAVRMREGVPRRRNNLGRMPHMQLSTLFTREEASVMVEKETNERRQQFGGFKYPEHMPVRKRSCSNLCT
jgi:hypothetical protein